MKDLKKAHIIVIILGILFLSITIFHENMWFDESYTVAIVRHSLSEIWVIGGNDVHPIFYYFILKIVSLVFGLNIIVYRLFSLLPLAILGTLGYTHIRKDFGEKCGLLFSFLILFLPEMTRYAGELRMYSWAMLFVSIMAIYAYRLYKNGRQDYSSAIGSKGTYNSALLSKKDNFTFNKNLVIFGIFSLLSAYTHYYGLMAAGIINLMLFIYLIKNFKNRKQDFIKFMIVAGIQVLIYIPWFLCFITQLNGVASGFWLGLKFPDSLIKLINLQFCDNLNQYVSLAFVILLYIYIGTLIYKEKKAKNEIKPAIIAVRDICSELY